MRTVHVLAGRPGETGLGPQPLPQPQTNGPQGQPPARRPVPSSQPQTEQPATTQVRLPARATVIQDLICIGPGGSKNRVYMICSELFTNQYSAIPSSERGIQQMSLSIPMLMTAVLRLTPVCRVQAPGRPSPFASMQGTNKDSQAVNLQNLANMFSNSSTPLTAADLQKYQSAGLNMANFPSLPSVSSLLLPK